MTQPRSDEGSVILALLVAFTVGALIVTTLSVAIAGGERAQKDERYAAALDGADAGVQEAYMAIAALDSQDTSVALSGSATIDGVTYSWDATRDDENDLDWDVTSNAVAAGAGASTGRLVTATIQQPALFSFAAFADESVNFNGNNAVDSYPDPGAGDVGTNGVLNLTNNSLADNAYVFDSATKGEVGRCTGGPCSDLQFVDDDIDVAQAVSDDGFITRQLERCKLEQGTTTLEPFVGSSIAGGATAGETKVYCFSSFFADTELFTVTGAGRAAVFVEGGDVTLGNKNHSEVNNDVPGAPTAVQLQIYTTGSTVAMYNQSQVAAAIYGPNATCGGDGSSPGGPNAGTEFYGSMICKVIDNVGNWNLHYDTRLAGIGSGAWTIGHYAEP